MMNIKDKLVHYENERESIYWIDITREVMRAIDPKFASIIKKIEMEINIYDQNDYAVAEEEYKYVVKILQESGSIEHDGKEIRLTLKNGGIMTVWNSEWGGVKFR